MSLPAEGNISYELRRDDMIHVCTQIWDIEVFAHIPLTMHNFAKWSLGVNKTPLENSGVSLRSSHALHLLVVDVLCNFYITLRDVSQCLGLL